MNRLQYAPYAVAVALAVARCRRCAGAEEERWSSAWARPTPASSIRTSRRRRRTRACSTGCSTASSASSPGQIEPRVHRARSRRELDVESGRHRMDVQDPRAACSATTATASSPPRTRPIRSSAPRNKATSSFSNDFDAVDKVEALDKYTLKITLKNPVAELPRLRRQLPRRQHGLQEGRRGDGRELREEADRHRAVHVRRVPAAAVREARRQQAVFPRRAGARRDHLSLHPVRCERATSPSSRASST